MKKILSVIFIVSMLTMMLGTSVFADEFVVEKGFNDDGYNYKAHLYVGGGEAWDVEDAQLVMKWNEAWLSNKDKDADGKLDRHLGYDTYIDSGEWCTNHWRGTYVDDQGKSQHYTETCKIVAVTSNDELVDGYWIDENGKVIGEDIWGQFALTLDVYNDSGTGDHGVYYKGQPGLGNLQ
ncbi:MAG: hypothetical protein JJE29_07030 [Peptostreptococcaceae bacterium]|nr:hypothetical protein [Peptostreptococcaceae bacterium]